MAKLQLTDLTPGKSYKIQIQAYNKETGAESNWSQDYIFTSPEDLTTKLTNFYKTQLGSGGSIFAGILTGGTPTWKDVNLGFYVDADGYLSLKDRLYFDPTYNSNQGLLTVVGSITASSGTIGGFTIGSSSLYAGSGSNFVGIVPASFPFFAGATDNIGTGAKFSVTPAGALTATNANITGVITATSGTFTGTVNATGGNFTNTVTIGSNATNISIAGTSSTTSTAIYSGSTTFESGGFWMDASGRFSLGTIGTAGLSWNNAALTVKGAINATSGSFTGIVNVSSGGSLVAGNATDGVTIDSTGLYGYEGGIAVFTIPTSGSTSPTIANFKVIDTAIISGSGTNANLILGTTGAGAYNITLRGQDSGGASPATPAAIYNISNGTTTTYSAGTGFYFDRLGYFRVGTTTSYAKFDPTGSGTFTISGSLVLDTNNYWNATTGTPVNGAVGDFKVGNATSYLQWTPANTTLKIAGSITSTADISGGTITGGTFRTSSTAGNGTTAGVIIDSISARFYSNTSATAVTTISSSTGAITATSVDLTGIIKATSGYIGGTSAGWTIASSLLSNGNVGLYAPTTTTGEIALYAGSTFANRATAPFRIGYDGSITATSANITGTINATGGNFTSNVTIGGATSGSLLVGTGTNKINIVGTALDSTTYINTGATNATTGSGFYFGADGKFRLASSTNSLSFDGTNIVFTGPINSLSSTNLFTAFDPVFDNYYSGQTNSAAYNNYDTIGTLVSGSASARYLNFSVISGLYADAISATVTAASGNGTTITYTCAGANTTFNAGQVVSITGLKITTGASLNLTNVTIATVSATNFTVTNSTIGTSTTPQTGLVTLDYGNPLGIGSTAALFYLTYNTTYIGLNPGWTEPVFNSPRLIFSKQQGLNLTFSTLDRLSNYTRFKWTDVGVTSSSTAYNFSVYVKGIHPNIVNAALTVRYSSGAYGPSGSGLTNPGAATAATDLATNSSNLSGWTRIDVSFTTPNITTYPYVEFEIKGVTSSNISATTSEIDIFAIQGIQLTQGSTVKPFEVSKNLYINSNLSTDAYRLINPITSELNYSISSNGSIFTTGNIKTRTGVDITNGGSLTILGAGSLNVYAGGNIDFSESTTNIGSLYVNANSQYLRATGGMAFAPDSGNITLTPSSGNNTIISSGRLGFNNNASTATTTQRAFIAPSEGFLWATRASDTPLILQRTGSVGSVAAFYNDTTLAGYINITGANTVAYVTSSDYRIKTNVIPIQNAISDILKLNPVTYYFKTETDGNLQQGFLAHELQEVVPMAAFGKKDEVDEDGNPVYQGTDVSKVVPLLTAALQESIEKIEDLENRIAILENK